MGGCLAVSPGLTLRPCGLPEAAVAVPCLETAATDADPIPSIVAVYVRPPSGAMARRRATSGVPRCPEMELGR